MDETPDKTLTVAQVAAVLGVKPCSVFRYWAQGDGPRYFRLPGGARRVKPAWLNDWILGREGL